MHYQAESLDFDVSPWYLLEKFYIDMKAGSTKRDIERLVALEMGARTLCKKLEHEAMSNRNNFALAETLIRYNKIHGKIVEEIREVIDEEYRID